jgi:membrane associated rhomboid family serine protease
MFSHSLNVTHVISNVLILIIFGPLVCVKIGNKNTFFVYIFSGLLSFLLFNNQKNYENMMIKKDMSIIGINVSDIKQNELGQVNFNKFKTYTDKQLTYLEFYPFTNSFLIGSSGPIFSFVTMYLLFSLKKPKNTFLMVISLLLISKEIVFYFFRDVTNSGTIFGHIGGIFGGILFFIILFALNKKRVT